MTLQRSLIPIPNSPFLSVINKRSSEKNDYAPSRSRLGAFCWQFGRPKVQNLAKDRWTGVAGQPRRRRTRFPVASALLAKTEIEFALREISLDRSVYVAPPLPRQLDNINWIKKASSAALKGKHQGSVLAVTWMAASSTLSFVAFVSLLLCPANASVAEIALCFHIDSFQ